MTRREYEMMFNLSAQVGSAFNSTFTKAQKAILDMQREIEGLNKTQSDISAFQKQQGAVEATKSKLALLQKEYDNIQKEMRETGTYSSDLENKLLNKQRQIDKTSEALDRQTQKLDRMGDSLRSAGVDTDNLSAESEKLKGKIGELERQQEEAADGAQGFGEKSVNAISAVGDALIAAGIAKGLKEIADAYMECINGAGEFEATLSTVEALSGANADEMAALSAEAKELGATTKYTATESAEAMTYMGMAGWSAADMLQGMDGVLQLAAASGEDLSRVSDIVTDNLTAFGLTAADTAHFADVLAAAATNSNTSVGIMGETFKMSASVAGALGYSVEDVAVAVGLMANSGIKGSMAGTALRNTFNGLLEGVTLTGEAFGEYEYTSVNVDGTMKGLSESIDELRVYFDKMTEAERVNNAMAIAGQRGYNGLLAILNATDNDYQALTQSINECSGAAGKMAEIKMDNMVGQLTLAQSAWDAIKTTIGEQFTPAMADLYAVAAKVMGGINSFLQKNPALIKAITVFIAILGGVVGGIVAVTLVVKALTIANAALTASIPGLNIIVGITAGVAALTGLLVGLASATKEEQKEVYSLTTASREQYFQLQDVIEEHEKACEIYGETSEEAQYLAWRVEELTDEYESGKQTLEDYIAECESLNDSLNETLNANRDAYNEISADEGKTLALTHRLQELASQTDQTTETQEEMKAIIAELNEIVPDLALSYEDVVSGVTDYGAAIDAAVKSQAAMARYEAAQQSMVDALNAQYDAEQQLASLRTQRDTELAQVEDLEAAYNSAYEAWLNWITQGGRGNNPYEKQKNDAKAAFDASTEAIESYEAEIADLENTYSQAVSDYELYKSALTDYIEVTYGADDATQELNISITDIMGRVQELAQAYTDAYNAAYESISGQYSLWDKADEVVATGADAINAALESQATYWSDYNANLAALSERTGEIEGLQEVIASFADGSTDSVNAIAGMAEASDEDLRKMVENWQTVQAEQDAAASSIADLKTDFTATMDELIGELNADIQSMDLSAEAAQSGADTIQGFIDGASDMLPQVQTAFTRIGRQAMISMMSTSGYYGLTLPAYASGTEAAERGMALVGENGPELVFFNGGEQVLNARETAAMQNDMEVMAFAPQLLMALSQRSADSAISAISGMHGGGSNISVVFQIEGSADETTVAVLQAYGDEFAERVLEVIREADYDAERRAYR